jgi:hypothetical protein
MTKRRRKRRRKKMMMTRKLSLGALANEGEEAV